MKHGNIDALDEFLYKTVRIDDTSQDMGKWQKTTPSPRQRTEETTETEAST